MRIQASVIAFREVPAEGVRVDRVWDLDEAELSAHATGVLKALETEETLHKMANRAAWLGLSLLEFQDLQPLVIPQKGQFLHRNYLFHEALAALRECVVSGLNGLFHASFAVFRSALELFVSHYWWRERLNDTDSYERFYRWLGGEARLTPGFQKVIHDTYARVRLPASARDREALLDVYGRLCSYAHKPIRLEAATFLKGGNATRPSPRAVAYWLELLTEALDCLLDFGIAQHPQAVFPVNVYRKFGYNVPVGALLDQFSFVPISAALGEARIAEYQRHYRVEASEVLKWYEGHPDLSDSEIIESWTGKDRFDDDDADFEARLFLRAAATKAHIRATLLSFSYGAFPHWVEMNEGNAIVTMVTANDAPQPTEYLPQ